MILHIPHSSTDTLGKEFLCDLELELERVTDVDTDRLFDHPEATRVVFPVSRLVCDVERFEDDRMEEMADRGMGVCYTSNSFGEPLREVSAEERSEIIERYYRPHHRRLTEAVAAELETTGSALVVDCHSFPATPLPCNLNQHTPRPDICIGTDSFHTPRDLQEDAEEYFNSCGYTVAIDNPFSGTLIPMEYYRKDRRVHGIMIEVNRDLYGKDFESVREDITAWLDRVASVAARRF